MPTKPITVQKTKNSGSFEFSLCNNSDVATDSSRIFHDFSHTKALRDSKHIIRTFLFCERKKSDMFSFPNRKIWNRRSGAGSFTRESRIRREVKNAGKISKTHASSSKPKSESLITVFSARCTDSPILLPFYSLSLSLSQYFSFPSVSSLSLFDQCSSERSVLQPIAQWMM